MREVVGQIEKERASFMVANELHGLFRVASRELGLVSRFFDKILATVQGGGPPGGVLVEPRGCELGDARRRVHIVRVGQTEVEIEAMPAGMGRRVVRPHS